MRSTESKPTGTVGGPQTDESRLARRLTGGSRWKHRLGGFANSLRVQAAASLLALTAAGDASWKRNKRSQSELALLAAIVETCEDAIYGWDVNGKINSWNQGAADIYGYSRREIIGQPYAVLVRRERRLIVADLLDQVRRGKGVALYEADMVRKDGSLIAVSVTMSPVRAPNGNVIGGATIARDITSRRRSQAALLASQARTRSILAAANDAFVEMDVSGVITDWNRSAEGMFGWSSEEAVGRVLSETIIPVEFRPMHEAGFKRFLATGEGPRLGPRVEVTALHRDGHQFPAELSVWLTGEPGRYSFNAFLQDITEEKRDQERLQDTLSLLGATLEATADGLMVVDRSGRMTSSNRTFAEMWRLPASVIEAGDANAAIAAALPHLEDPAAFVEEIGRMAGLPDAESHDTLRFKDGRVFERYSRPQLVDGVAVGRVWSFHDVSDLKALEVDLAEARDRALESSRLKSEFLATMSHEIRTPMNGVIGLISLLLDSDLDEPQRQYAEGVQASGEALLGLINDVLDLSKIEAGKLEIEMVDFDLVQALDDVVALVAAPARAKSLELVVNCPPHLPAMVCGDVGRLRQVLLNLLSNAIKFTDAGEVVLRASIVGAAGPDRVTMRLEVADTGIGIDSATSARLFEPFSQADVSTTRRYGGTGLGLAICRRLADAMGGSVGLESRLGHGSTFWLDVPLGLAAEPIGEPSPLGGPLRDLKVLLVDDNEACRLALACHLLAWDITADVVADGHVAMQHLRSEARSRPYDVALIDMAMEGMDGLELAMRVMADPALPSVKMLLLSSETISTATLTAAGFAARLAKPVRATELHDALLRLVVPPVVGTDVAPPSTPVQRVVGSRGQLLIVEDNVINQAVAKGMAANLGYGCDVAANGIEALQALQRRHYDAVLMDCRMPEMDGFQATAEIRRLHDGTEAVPVIAMTASARKEDIDRCLAAGMDDFLAKPVRQLALDQMLDKWLPSRPSVDGVEGRQGGRSMESS